MYDVIIVGSGPAGMFAADELSKHNIDVLIIDKHKLPGGAGTWTDGKLNLSHEIGMDVNELKISVKNAKKLINRIKDSYINFGAEPILSGIDKKGIKKISTKVKKVRQRNKEHNIKFITAQQLHMGSDNTQRIVQNFMNSLISRGVKFSLKTRVDKIINSKKYFSVKSGRRIFKSKFLIVAPGRSGAYWFREQAKSLGVKTEFGQIDIGVRIEFPAKVYEEITKIQYDPKFKFITPTYKDTVRTFCTNPGGWITSEKNKIDGEEIIIVNGHARRDKKTKNTNLALLYTVALTHPQVDSTRYGFNLANFINFISGHKPMVQRYGDLKKGKRSYHKDIRKNRVLPTFKQCNPGDIGMALTYRALINIKESIEILNNIAPGVADDSTLIYAPEIKFYDTKYPATKNMQTNVKNLYVGGDGTGKSRGIVGAAISGILAAQGIIKSHKV